MFGNCPCRALSGVPVLCGRRPNSALTPFSTTLPIVCVSMAVQGRVYGDGCTGDGCTRTRYTRTRYSTWPGVVVHGQYGQSWPVRSIMAKTGQDWLRLVRLVRHWSNTGQTSQTLVKHWSNTGQSWPRLVNVSLAWSMSV